VSIQSQCCRITLPKSHVKKFRQTLAVQLGSNNLQRVPNILSGFDSCEAN